VVLPASAPCRGPQLKLSADGGDAGAGNRVSVLGVQNIGAQACSLTGYPTVVLQDRQARNLTAIRADQTLGSYFRQGQAPTPVELAPQAKAFFDIAWNVVPNEGNGETTCPSAARHPLQHRRHLAGLSWPGLHSLRRDASAVSPFRPVAEPAPAPAAAT
jgi:hypothetical protein